MKKLMITILLCLFLVSPLLFTGCKSDNEETPVNPWIEINSVTYHLNGNWESSSGDSDKISHKYNITKSCFWFVNSQPITEEEYNNVSSAEKGTPTFVTNNSFVDDPELKIGMVYYVKFYNSNGVGSYEYSKKTIANYIIKYPEIKFNQDSSFDIKTWSSAEKFSVKRILPLSYVVYYK